ncbi:MAG: Aspartate-proton symporter [Candidatus Anoxychlamydiales bacterium]|nr:Aspartate-proton symporter [Candidatus Anoxychlamydiales bacterium]
MALKRTINKFALLTAAIGGIIGSGWLFGPFYAAKIAGPASILSWAIGGVLMLFIAYTFAVLTKTLPIVGGTVRFFQITYGHFVGFTFSWIAWLAWVAVTPIETLALLQYAANYLPFLMKTVNNTQELSLYGFGVAIILMFIIYVMNVKGLKFLTKSNYFIVFLKIAVPIATVIILFYSKFKFSNFYQIGGFAPMGIKNIFSALPIAGVIYSFIGYNPAIQLAAEVKNPQKALPFAIFGSLFICIILYTIIQIAFIGAVDASYIKNGWENLSFIGDTGPFAGMITALGFTWFVKILYIDAAISPYGTALVQATATTRLTYAMGQNNYLPTLFMKLNKHHTPTRAMLFNILIGIIFILPFPSWQKMVGFLVSCLVFGYVVAPLSLMAMRTIHFHKNQKHIFSKKIEFICLISFYICNLLIYWTGWSIIKKVAITFALGYLVLFLLYLIPSTKKKIKLDLDKGWWAIIYIVGITSLSYFSSFGDGINKIKFGYDFLAIAIFSIFIFYLAKIIIANRTKKIEKKLRKQKDTL